jgi:hypothetical protein
MRASHLASLLSMLTFAGAANCAELQLQLLGGIPFRAGDPFNGNTVLEGKSEDGRFLLLWTEANNLAPGIVDFNQRPDYYLFDRFAESYDLISRSAANPERAAVPPEVGPGTGDYPDPTSAFTSDDGRWVAFTSSAKDMVAGATYPSAWAYALQVFLFDRESRTMRLVSHASNSALVASSGTTRLFAMSSDGRFVAFESRGDNLAAAGGGFQQIYLFDRESGENLLVTHRAGRPGSPGLANSWGSAMTPDGRFIGLGSSAADLVAGQVDRASSFDAFLYDRLGNSMELLTVAAGTAATAAGGNLVNLTDDGRFATLISAGVALAAGVEDGNGNDATGGIDCFLLDRQAGSARLVSRSAANPSRSADQTSNCQALSRSGRHVFFTSRASDLVAGFADNNAFGTDAYVFDARSGQVTLASRQTGSETEGADAAVDWDGEVPAALDDRYRMMVTWANNLQAGGADIFSAETDIFLYDLEGGDLTLVSRLGSSQVAGGGVGTGAHFTADGTILFNSRNALDRAFPTGFSYQVYRFDVAQGAVRLDLRTPLPGILPDAAGGYGMLDRNGRFFGRWDRVLDAVSGQSQRVVHALGEPSSPANGGAQLEAASADGRYVVYTTEATDVAPVTDGNERPDVFVYDRLTLAPRLVSHASGNTAQTSSGRPTT